MTKAFTLAEQMRMINIISQIIYSSKFKDINLDEDLEDLNLSLDDKKAMTDIIDNLFKIVRKHGQENILKLQKW